MLDYFQNNNNNNKRIIQRYVILLLTFFFFFLDGHFEEEGADLDTTITALISRKSHVTNPDHQWDPRGQARNRMSGKDHRQQATSNTTKAQCMVNGSHNWPYWKLKGILQQPPRLWNRSGADGDSVLTRRCRTCADRIRDVRIQCLPLCCNCSDKAEESMLKPTAND